MNKTVDMARNKWKGIALALGIDRSFLTGKHGPCPMCGGKDRFRFDDKEGRGTYHCRLCGAGSGFDLVQKIKGWDFRTAAVEIDKIVGRVEAQPAKRPADPTKQRDAMNRLWQCGTRIEPGCSVAKYLEARRVGLPQSTDCIRYVDKCPVPGGGVLPAMVSKVTGIDGKPVNLHRTFLGPNGKAEIDAPRATMPGPLPEGCAIRLAPHGDKLGIAEGIETALAASARFGLPVWAAINATMLEKWQPPEGVKTVLVFADNDESFTGQAASYALAKRLKRDGYAADVVIPHGRGMDWADEGAE